MNWYFSERLKYNFMSKRIWLVFIFTSLSFSLNASILTSNQKNTIAAQINKFIDSDKGISYVYESSGNVLTCIINNDTFYNPNGFHYIYHLKNGQAIRKDHSPYHGHNFRRNLIVYKNDIYLLGGYGFFETNNNLEKFSFKTKEWDYVPTTGEKPPFIRGTYLQKEELIYCFGNKKSGNNMEPDIYDEHIYKLNMASRVWTKFENINADLKNIKDPTEIYLKDYVIIVYSGYTNIINKKTLEYIKISNDGLNFTYVNIRDKEIIKDENKFTCTYSGAIDNDYLKITNDADQLWKTHYMSAKQLVLEPNFFQSYSYYLMVFAFFAIVITLIWYYRLYKIIIPSKQFDALFPIINRFVQISKNKISLDELDEIFEINHMEAESKKSKRHRMLKNIAQKHPGFIQREKDELDRRKFSYNLDFQALKQKK
jgi:hypothetical protein